MKSIIFVPTTIPSEKDAIFFAVTLSFIPNPTTTGKLVKDLIFFTLFFTSLKFLSSAPKEAVQLPIFFMIAGDGILVALWYFGLREIVDTLKEFRLGIGLSFVTSSFGRSIYLMIMSKDV